MSNPPAEEHTHTTASREPGTYWVYGLLAALVLFHVVNNVYWASVDNRLFRVDEAYHVNKAADLYLMFSNDSEHSLFEHIKMLASFRTPYPPLSYMIGAVFCGLFGYSPDHVALSSTFMFILTILGIYAVARQFLPRGPSLYATFVASFVPLLYGLSRMFALDFFAVPIVVWAIYALLRSENFTRTRWVALFAVLNGLGLLAKQTTFAFLLLPSAFVLAAGLWQAWRHRPEGTRLLPTLMPFLRNIVVTLLLSVATFSWWYVPQASYMYRWWSTNHMHGRGFLEGGVEKALDNLLSYNEGEQEGALDSLTDDDDRNDTGTEVDGEDEGNAEGAVDAVAGTGTAAQPPAPKPEVPAAQPAPAPPATGKPAASRNYGIFKPFAESWDRYLIFAINDVFFLPMFLLGCLSLLALRQPRYRTVKALMPWVWVIGTYLVMTWLFKSKTPRYLAPMAPAFGILCAMTLYQIRHLAVRRIAMAAFAALLIFQYGNLTWFSYGAFARKEIPVLQQNDAVTWCVNNGLTLYKDLIVTGVYVIRAPVRGQNSADRILSDMALYERHFPPDKNTVSKYRLVARQSGQPGFTMAERHYGPPDNPRRPVNSGSTYDSPRYLEQITPEVRNPSQLMDHLQETNYVILKPGEGDDVDLRLMQWVMALKPYGFQTIDHFYEPGYGKYWSSWYHVLARRPALTLDSARDLFDLCELRAYPPDSTFAVPATRRGELEKNIYREMLSRRDQKVPFSDDLNLVTVQVVQITEGWYQIRLAFEVVHDIRNDYRIYVHATVNDADQDKVPTRFRNDKRIQWNFNPAPPTSTWKAGQIIALRRDVMAEPIMYHLAFGMTGPDGHIYGNRITAGWVDFSHLGGLANPPLPPHSPQP